MVRRQQVHATLLLCEDLEIATKGHAVLIVVEEGWNLGRSGAMSPQELCLLIVPRSPERQI
jgi:hypothetical protein